MPPTSAANGDGRDAVVPVHCRSPIFILTASRSGSTLLRFILDSHPDLACPPETSVSASAATLARTWEILEKAGSDAALMTDQTALAPHVIEAVRAAVDHAYGSYLARRGKLRWCDKSLESHHNAELLAMLYPEARFVCLYRHCMDVIASGVEACPWGLHRHGFDPYAARNPGNSVAAVGSYWLDTVRAIMEFEEKRPDICYRVRYEDLVTAPEETVAGMFSFLGATPVPGIASAAFQVPHEANGPGDEKIWFTSDVTDRSMGRGFQVPAAGLPGPLRQAVNDTLAKLSYRPVDDRWDAQTGPSDPRTDAPSPPRLASPPADGHGPDPADEVAAVARAIAARAPSGPGSELGELALRWPALAGKTVALVIQAPHGARQELRWSFPAHDESVDGAGETGSARDGHRAHEAGADEPVAVIIADPAAWQSLLSHATNIITEVTAGRVRCVNRRDGHRLRTDELHAIACMLGLARIPLARPPAAVVPAPGS